MILDYDLRTRLGPSDFLHCVAHDRSICGDCGLILTPRWPKESYSDHDIFQAVLYNKNNKEASGGTKGEPQRMIEPASGNADQVALLSGMRSRFVPQWDVDVMGRSNIVGVIKVDPERPPKHLMPPEEINFSCCFFGCSGLTWLKPYGSSLTSGPHVPHCPSHHSSFDSKLGTKRSLFVRIDGALETATETGRRPRGGLGVYFGFLSKYNASEMIDVDNMNQNTPVLAAAYRALQIVREKVMADRRRKVFGASTRNTIHSVKTATHLRLLLATDSKYVVDVFTILIEKNWHIKEREVVHADNKQTNHEKEAVQEADEEALESGAAAVTSKADKKKARKARAKARKDAEEEEKAQQQVGEAASVKESQRPPQTELVLRNKSKAVVQDSALILAIKQAIELVAEHGVQVAWYLVPAESNILADRLARQALEE